LTSVLSGCRFLLGAVSLPSRDNAPLAARALKSLRVPLLSRDRQN
jgi:hypothetical protein